MSDTATALAAASMPNLSAVLRAIAYIDGFNLYYGCLKGTPYRWLDVTALRGRLLRADTDIVAVKNFTARVQPRAGNPQQAQRQQVYIRALETTPALTIHYGHFITRPAMRRLASPPKRGSKYAEVGRPRRRARTST